MRDGVRVGLRLKCGGVVPVNGGEGDDGLEEVASAWNVDVNENLIRNPEVEPEIVVPKEDVIVRAIATQFLLWIVRVLRGNPSAFESLRSKLRYSVMPTSIARDEVLRMLIGWIGESVHGEVWGDWKNVVDFGIKDIRLALVDET